MRSLLAATFLILSLPTANCQPPNAEPLVVLEPTYLVVYRVKDFPVWAEDQTFAPHALIGVISFFVPTQHQPTNRAPFTKESPIIRPDAKTSSLIVSATKKQHEKVTRLLEAFRSQLKQ